MKANAPGLRVEPCYAMAARAGVVGKTLRFVLQPGGAIVELCAPGTRHPSAELSACFVGGLQKKTPAPSRGDGTVAISFPLRPTPGP